MSALSQQLIKGSNEQTRKHDKHKTKITQMIHKRSTVLERSVKTILLEDLKWFLYAGLLIVVWLFFTMPRVYLQFVIVVFPDHTHRLFLYLASPEDKT